MIPTRSDIVERLKLSGALAGLPWVKVSRNEPPNVSAAVDGDIVYRIRSNEDIAKAHPRKPPTAA